MKRQISTSMVARLEAIQQELEQLKKALAHQDRGQLAEDETEGTLEGR